MKKLNEIQGNTNKNFPDFIEQFINADSETLKELTRNKEMAVEIDGEFIKHAIICSGKALPFLNKEDRRTIIKREESLLKIIDDFHNMRKGLNEWLEEWDNIMCLLNDEDPIKTEYEKSLKEFVKGFTQEDYDDIKEEDDDLFELNSYVFSIIDGLTDMEKFKKKHHIEEVYSVLHSFPEYDGNARRAIVHAIKSPYTK